MMYKMIHGQVESGNCLIQTQGHTWGHNQDSYSHTQELMLIYFLITLQQLDYGIICPALLLNLLRLTYLSNILILDSIGMILCDSCCTIYSIWRFLYSNKIQCNKFFLAQYSC